MKLRSPVVAMLWELWRVTRVEVALKLAWGVVVAPIPLLLSAVFAPSEIAEWDEDIIDVSSLLLFLPHLVAWPSLARLNGSQWSLPLYLHYTRPIRTAVMVGVPNAYLTAMSVAIYLVSAFLLSVTSGHSFSLLPAAAWIAALTCALGALGWWTRNMVVLMVGMLVVLFAWGSVAGARLDSFPNDVDYPLTDYALIALFGLICFSVTVVAAARARRGDAHDAIARTPGSELWDWLVNLFRFPCPTSSAIRAQIWLDLKSDGLPVLTIGLVLAIVILLLSAIGNPIDAAFQNEIRASLSCSNADCFLARAWPVMFTVLSLLLVLFLGRNAFGIRSRHGRTSVSAFEATQACGTAQLAALKVLVKSGCVLAAIITIGVSAWISVPLLGDPVFIQMWNLPLRSRLPAISDAVEALTVYEQLSLVVLAALGVVIWVAACAALGALRVRHSRRIYIAASSPLLFGLALVLVGTAQAEGIVSPSVFFAMLAAARWIFLAALAAMALTTVYLFRSGFAERVLTIRYASGAAVTSAAFATAWLIVLHMAGVQLAEMSAIAAVSILSPVLLPPLLSVLAPWTLNRVRHM
jgi:hypothetical protein